MGEYLLTTEERQRFVRYCRQYAESCRLIIAQLEKLDPKVASIVVPCEQQRMSAYMHVAEHLESMEEASIG